MSLAKKDGLFLKKIKYANIYKDKLIKLNTLILFYITNMDTTIDKIETSEEFFLVFNGLCKIAESSFNNFDEKDLSGLEPQAIAKEISYLMSITFVIIGMRGQYLAFRKDLLNFPFFVITNGQEYNQAYLYKMNDYFTKRFDDTLSRVKKMIPEHYDHYKNVWQNY